MLKLSEKISYAVLRFGTSITMDLADLFTGFVYYLFFGLSEDPFLAFLGVATGKLVIGFMCYISGNISDRTETRIGRRKPFVVIGMPILAIAFFLLYNPHLILPANSSKTVIFGYLLLFNSIYQAAYGFLIIPYQAVLPEITQDEEERLVVSGFQNAFNIFAFILGAGTSFLLPVILGSNESYSLSDLHAPNEVVPFLTDGQLMTVIVLIFAIIPILTALPFLLKVKEKETKLITHPSFREELEVATSNKNFLAWTISRSILQISIAGLIGILLAWIEEVLGLGGTGYILFGGTLLTCILAGYAVWIRVGNNPNIGKTKSFIISMSALAVIMLGFLVIGQFELPIPILYQALIIAVLGALSLSCFYLLPYAITGDMAAEDEIRTGQARAGLYYGFELIVMNMAQVIGYLMVGVLLSLPKTTNIVGNTFSIGYLYFGPVSSVIIIIAVIIFWKYVNADPLRKL